MVVVLLEDGSFMVAFGSIASLKALQASTIEELLTAYSAARAEETRRCVSALFEAHSAGFQKSRVRVGSSYKKDRSLLGFIWVFCLGNSHLDLRKKTLTTSVWNNEYANPPCKCGLQPKAVPRMKSGANGE